MSRIPPVDRNTTNDGVSKELRRDSETTRRRAEHYADHGTVLRRSSTRTLASVAP